MNHLDRLEAESIYILREAKKTALKNWPCCGRWAKTVMS